MEQTTKEWIYIICLFIISILFFINSIDEIESVKYFV